MKLTKSKIKEFKSFSNRFHNSDTIRIKDKNEYNRIMKYLDKTKWPYYDIGGGKGAFHIQFDNTKDTSMIRGILQKKGFKLIDPNTEGKLREIIREELLKEKSWEDNERMAKKVSDKIDMSVKRIINQLKTKVLRLHKGNYAAEKDMVKKELEQIKDQLDDVLSLIHFGK